MDILEHPLMPGAVDLLMMVGAESYPRIRAFIQEANKWGVSKRIPLTAVPEGIVPNVSRLFLWHPQALPVVSADGKTLTDLLNKLVEMGALHPMDIKNTDLEHPWNPSEHLLPSDYVPDNILEVSMTIQDLQPAERRSVEQEFKIKWHGGVFMYTVLGELEYVVCETEDVEDDDIVRLDLPDEVKRLGNIVRPVVIQYVDDDGKPIDADDAPEEE